MQARSKISQLKIAAVLRTEKMGRALTASCREINGHNIDIHIGRLENVRPDIAGLRGSDVLLLELDLSDKTELATLREIVHSRFPDKPIVVTTANLDLNHMRKLMRLGVVDVLPQPIKENDLLTALSSAAALKTLAADEDIKGTVVSVLGMHGGAGATTIAVNLGHILATRRQAKTAQTCLLDLNPQFGSAALYMDIESRVGIPDLLDAADRLDGTLFRDVMAHHKCGLDILSTPVDRAGPSNMDRDFISRCLDIAVSEYRHTLIDLPQTWTPYTAVALKRSDHILLVTQLTVAGIRQARRWIELFRSKDMENLPLKIVLNRFDSNLKKQIKPKDAEKALDHQIDYCISSDFWAVNEALNTGVAISELKKKSKLTLELRKIADDLDGTEHTQVAGWKNIFVK